MARQVLLFLLVAFLNVSLILCREDYQHHISDSFSHHHRRSTPEDSVVSTKDPLSVTEGDGKPLGEIQHGYRINPPSYQTDTESNALAIITFVLVVLGSIIISLCIGITFFCARRWCSKRRQGVILYKPLENSDEVRPQPPGYEAPQQSIPDVQEPESINMPPGSLTHPTQW